MKYICWLNILKNVLWRVAKRLSYIWDARCLKVNLSFCARAFGRVVSVQSLTPRHEDIRGSGGTAPQLLSLDTRYINYKLHATDTFLLEKKHPIPTAHEGRWAPEPFSTLWWTEMSLPLPANHYTELSPPPQVNFGTLATLGVPTEIAARIFIILENFPKNCRPISVFYNVQL